MEITDAMIERASAKLSDLSPWDWSDRAGTIDFEDDAKAIIEAALSAVPVSAEPQPVAAQDDELETRVLHFLCEHLQGHSVTVVRAGIGRMIGFSVGKYRTIAIRDLLAVASPADLAAENARLREAVMTIVQAVRKYLPQNGISKEDLISEVIRATDNQNINPVIAKFEAENGNS